MKPSPKMYDSTDRLIDQTRDRIGFVRGRLPLDEDELKTVCGTTLSTPVMPNLDQDEFVMFMKAGKARRK